MKAIHFLLPMMISAFACNDEPAADGNANKSANGDSVANSLPHDDSVNAAKGTYAYDAAFLKKYTRRVLELHNGNSRVLLSADYQGRVMTSTAKGEQGTSYGWLNYSLIGAREFKPQFNPVGGEERFWLGPEGGQFSIYFKGKEAFDFKHWRVPPVIDTVTYDVAAADDKSATFTTTAKLVNYSGTEFNLGIRRTINLLDATRIAAQLHVSPDPSLAAVAYSTENVVTNNGSAAWKKETGLLSIWLLAMLTPSEQTRVIIPFNPGKDAGSLITTDYFGPIPKDRLRITDSYLVLNCDGRFRSKIGIPPSIARPIAGSFDFEKNILTVTMFTVDKNGSYVNSKWELQQDPYGGDAVNAYNDGPLEDGSQMGPFYEIESSSAARELKPGESQNYKQYTFHFEGDYPKLEKLALELLGVKLSDIK